MWHIFRHTNGELYFISVALFLLLMPLKLNQREFCVVVDSSGIFLNIYLMNLVAPNW